MATYEQNLRKIRGEAVYGTEVRIAIADAIEQADDSVQPAITAYKQYVDNAVQGVSDRADAIQLIIDQHTYYINTVKISGTADDYIMGIWPGHESLLLANGIDF